MKLLKGKIGPDAKILNKILACEFQLSFYETEQVMLIQEAKMVHYQKIYYILNTFIYSKGRK